MNSPEAHHSTAETGGSARHAQATPAPAVNQDLASRVIDLCRPVVTLDPSNFEDSCFSRCIDALQTVQGRHARPASELPFQALQHCFPHDFLESVMVIGTPTVPAFPWQSIDLRPRPLHVPLGQNIDTAALSLRNAYFIRQDHMDSALTHAQQLARVAQWQLLGDEAYLWLAAAAHVRADSAVSPIRSMAERIAIRVLHGQTIPALDLVQHEMMLLASGSDLFG